MSNETARKFVESAYEELRDPKGELTSVEHSLFQALSEFDKIPPPGSLVLSPEEVAKVRSVLVNLSAETYTDGREDETARQVMFVWADEISAVLDDLRVRLEMLPDRNVP